MSSGDLFNDDGFSLFDDNVEGNNSSSKGSNANDDILVDLNDKQREAVLHVDGPILVLAGAGSGKTRVLTRRVANLVLNHNVYPSQILAVTFTNKATNEMLSRLSVLLGGYTNSLWVNTFHAMSVKILRRNAEYIGYDNNFSIYDTKDTQTLIKKICKEQRIDEKKYSVEYLRGRISNAKNNFEMPEDISENVGLGASFSQFAEKEKAFNIVYKEYQKELKNLNAMDFDDLLLNTYELLITAKDVLEYYQEKFHYILVDEFQDTNEVQYRIISLLAGKYRNIFVVGDDDQSIYSFRGARPSNITMFEKDFVGTFVVKLEQNYRSTSNILDASNSIIAKNISRKPKKLWTSGQRGDLITLYSALDENSEARYVATQIRSLVDSGKYNYKDIACFYRTNAQSRALEEALMSRKILYRIYGTLKFWDRKEIKDIVSYLRLVVNENDDQSFLRVVNTPNRGIGVQTVENLIRDARQKGVSLFVAASMSSNQKLNAFVLMIQNFKNRSKDIPLYKLLETIYTDSTYKERLKLSKDPTAESRIENIEELIAYAQTVSNGVSDSEQAISVFMDKVSLSGSDESYESKNAKEESVVDTVSLMTVHLAKGLEFPVVFFIGLEEGLVPHVKAFNNNSDLEEERRLCYVGMTRAMKKLYLTNAKKRTVYGGNKESSLRAESRFLKDIPSELLEKSSEVLESAMRDYDEAQGYGSIDYRNERYSQNSLDSDSRYDMDINYRDASNFDFLPTMHKKKFEKKKNEKLDVFSMVCSAKDLGEPIGNYRKLDISELKVGMRLRHPNFGDGILRDIQGVKTVNDPFKVKLCIDFDGIPDQKKLILGKASFEII